MFLNPIFLVNNGLFSKYKQFPNVYEKDADQVHCTIQYEGMYLSYKSSKNANVLLNVSIFSHVQSSAEHIAEVSNKRRQTTCEVAGW